MIPMDYGVSLTELEQVSNSYNTEECYQRTRAIKPAAYTNSTAHYNSYATDGTTMSALDIHKTTVLSSQPSEVHCCCAVGGC